MKLAPILTFVFLAIAKPPAPVAIVYSLTGTATLESPARSLHRLDRLQAGAIIEVGPASRLALFFASGVRYELGEGSRVVIGKTDLSSRAGLVKALPKLPPFPILVAISEAEKPGARAGAVRIRGEEIEGLSPQGGAATLADATVLRFQPVDGASRYQVEVADSRGNIVFQVATEASALSVPAGTLVPGVHYHWAVKALDRPGPVIRGKADFRTLTRDVAAAYQRLKWAVGETDGELLEAVGSAMGMAASALSPIPVESKTRPVIGVRVLTFGGADQIELRGAQGIIFRLALTEIRIEPLHESRRRDVGDAPQ